MRPTHRLASLPGFMTRVHREAVRDGVRVLNTDLLLAARTHSALRCDKTCELLLHTHMLANKQYIDEQTTIATTGAWYQNQRGSADDDTQAAHFLPRQPTFNGLSMGGLLVTAQKASEVIKEPNGLLATQINSTCGGTTIADKILNETDILLEREGLARIFEQAVRAAAAAGLKSPGDVCQAALLDLYKTSFREPLKAVIIKTIGICDQAISAQLPDAASKERMKKILEIYLETTESHVPDLANQIPMESMKEAWSGVNPRSADTATTTTAQTDASPPGSSNNSSG